MYPDNDDYWYDYDYDYGYYYDDDDDYDWDYDWEECHNELAKNPFGGEWVKENACELTEDFYWLED